MEHLEAKDFPQIKDGKVTLSFQEYLEYLAEAKATEEGREPPYRNFVNNASYVGQTKDDCINFDVEFKVVVIKDQDWINTVLFRSNVTVHSQNFEVISSEDQGSSEAYFSYNSPHHVFIAKKGVYKIKMNISVPYNSKQKKGFSLWTPQSTYNYLDFTVNSPDVDIQIDSGLEMEHEHTDNKTRVTGRLPNMNDLSVEWTQKTVPMQDDILVAQPEEKIKPMSVHSSQNILHTVGDRLITSTVQTQYSINNGSLSSLAIRIQSFGKFLRILRVDGHSIKKWEIFNRGVRRTNNDNDNTNNNDEQEGEGGDIEPISTNSDISSERSSSREPYKLLKVYLDHSIEGSYNLNINTELELPSSTCDLKFPSFSSSGVDRDRGYIAIEAKSSVEINEKQICGLGRVDKSELPLILNRKSTNPIIYSYKFLQRNYWLHASIKKHEDVDVLVTCIDQGYFVATYGEGIVLHSTTLSIRNTQKQYLRVSLPQKSSIWSVTVEGEPVKPAADKQKRLLVPLKQSGSNDAAPFPVEIVFIERTTAFKTYGNIDISFAKFDIPINHLFVSVYVPKNARYGEFSGNIKEVEMFSKNPQVILPKPAPPQVERYRSRNVRRVAPQAQVATNIALPVEDEEVDDVDDVDDLFSVGSVSSGSDDMDSLGGTLGEPEFKQSTGIGMLPVKIDKIAVGKYFRFEKVLASADDRISLSVPFKKFTKGFFDKRRTYNLGYIIGTGAAIGGMALSYYLAKVIFYH